MIQNPLETKDDDTPTITLYYCHCYSVKETMYFPDNVTVCEMSVVPSGIICSSLSCSLLSMLLRINFFSKRDLQQKNSHKLFPLMLFPRVFLTRKAMEGHILFFQFPLLFLA